MKRTILFTIFVCCGLSMYAQEDICGTSSTREEMEGFLELLSTSTYVEPRNSTTIYFPIKHHIVRKSNGTGGLSASTTEKVIEDLNRIYSAANVQFYSQGEIIYINNDTYYNFIEGPINDGPLMNAYNSSNAINIYYFNLITTADGLSKYSGYTYNPHKSERIRNFIAIKNEYAEEDRGVTVIHEMGHFLGLYHTHESGKGPEHPNGSNCSTAGDLICDTPADPGLGLSGMVDNTTCRYIGTATYKNDKITRYNPDVSNYMNYANHRCRTRFTNGQIQRLKEIIANPIINLMSLSSIPTEYIVRTTVNLSSGSSLNYPLIKIVSGGILNINGGQVTADKIIIENGGRLNGNNGTINCKTFECSINCLVELKQTMSFKVTQ